MTTFRKAAKTSSQEPRSPECLGTGQFAPVDAATADSAFEMELIDRCRTDRRELTSLKTFE
jgi:hypothetical protein